MTLSTSFPHEVFVPAAADPDGMISGFSAHYYWMFTIRPSECRLFNAVFDRVGSSEQAIGFLAERYPFGLPPESDGVLSDDDVALLDQVSVAGTPPGTLPTGVSSRGASLSSGDFTPPRLGVVSGEIPSFPYGASRP